MSLKGKTAVITGSCSEGMGRSAALRLAREGANIVLNYGTHRSGTDAATAADRIVDAVRSLGGEAIICQADTTDETQVQSIIRAAIDAFGAVDILINNAGGDWVVRDLTVIDAEHWRKVLAAEIDATFYLLKHTLPGMRERRWGRIIHISMDGSLLLQTMASRAPDYCLGKAARSWMTVAWGMQEYTQGITVNCIEPGITSRLTFEEALEAAQGHLEAWSNRDKLNAHDVAETVAYLCSEAARFVSGSIIRMPTDNAILPH